MNPLLKHSDMARDSEGITQFYLRLTHESYLPLLPSCRASPPLAGTHCAYPRTDGQAELTWVTGYILRRIFRHRELNPDTVTHPSYNQARRGLTSLIETNALTTMPNRHTIPSKIMIHFPVFTLF